MTFNPSIDPNDSVYIDGQLVPGIVEIKGLNAARDWEERQSFGMMGSRLRLKGIKLSHFSLNVELYTEEHWNDWIVFSPAIRRPPPPTGSQLSAITSLPALNRVIRTQAPPMNIEHPLLEEYRITRVVVEDVVAPVQDPTGFWTIEIKLIQYQPPQRVLSTSGGRDRESGTSRQDREIAELTQQLDTLANQGNR